VSQVIVHRVVPTAVLASGFPHHLVLNQDVCPIKRQIDQQIDSEHRFQRLSVINMNPHFSVPIGCKARVIHPWSQQVTECRLVDPQCVLLLQGFAVQKFQCRIGGRHLRRVQRFEHRSPIEPSDMDGRSDRIPLLHEQLRPPIHGEQAAVLELLRDESIDPRCIHRPYLFDLIEKRYPFLLIDASQQDGSTQKLSQSECAREFLEFDRILKHHRRMQTHLEFAGRRVPDHSLH